jgi:predicted phage terminase large subunit-like protein
VIFFIIDDPQKPIDAQSDAQRNRLNQWFSNTLMSRLDNKEMGAIIVVMQRVHLNDLTGYLTDSSQDWTVLSLPAIAETDEKIAIGDNEFHIRRAGEALHPQHESLESLQKQQLILGPEVFAAQYMQRPAPQGGVMIRREWLRYYDRAPERDYRADLVLSLVTAAKGGAQNDFSVCTIWLFVDKQYYLLDVIRDRYEYPLLRSTVLAVAERYKPDIVLIEDASTGTALAQDLREVHCYRVELVPVEHDKIGRLYVQQAKFAAGRVFFPRGAPFLPTLEAELLTFPQGKHDDQVDSISQALAYEPSGYDSSLRWVNGD